MGTAGPAWARDATTAGGLAAGDAVRAHPREMGNIVNAPAMTTMAPRYDLAAGFRLGPDRVRLTQIEALDSSKGAYSMGVAFLWETANRAMDPSELPGWSLPDEDFSEVRTHYTLLAVGGGYSWLDRKVSLGASVIRMSESSSLGESARSYEATASLAARPVEPLYLVVSVENLVPDTDLDAPLKVSGGIRGLPDEIVAIEADLEVDLESRAPDPAVSYMAGLEVFAGEQVPLRVGYRHDALLDAEQGTAGVGITSEEASLDYGVRVSFDVDQTLAWHGVAARLTF